MLGLAERDAQMGAGVAGQQARSRSDVGAGQLQLAATLADLLATAATIDMPAVAMPFDLGFGNIGHDMVVELARGFEVAAAAMGALLGMHVVFDERRVRRRLGAKAARMQAEFLAATIALGAWDPEQRGSSCDAGGCSGAAAPVAQAARSSAFSASSSAMRRSRSSMTTVVCPKTEKSGRGTA